MTHSILQDDIHIVMCSYKRVCNLPEIIESLINQSVFCKIHLHILNNNPAETDNINHIIKNYNKNPSDKTQPNYKLIKITLNNYNNENNVFERFIYGRELRTYGIEYIIYIDDDMKFRPKWVERLYNKRKPKHFITWYIKLFIHNNKPIDYTSKDLIDINYNTDTIVTYNNVTKNENTQYTSGNYGGPGGSIIDTSIFENDDFFHIPDKEINLIDDIWISYYLIHILKWTIKRSYLVPLLIWNKQTIENALYSNLIERKRLWFLYFINNIPFDDITIIFI